MDAMPLYIYESYIKNILSWPLIYEAVEQAMRSVCTIRADTEQPISSQPARTLTRVDGSGILFSMPGFVGNYTLPSLNAPPNKKYNSLACKLVTSFTSNEKLSDPLPNIMATIMLFDTTTGKLKCILEASEITAWRTAAASLVATKHLFLNRLPNQENKILGIIGCGVQGRRHAIGMCSLFYISEIFLWNRTKSKVDSLSAELECIKKKFLNPNLKIHVSESVRECVAQADIIVTATFTSTPVLFYSMLKPNVHINTVGAGENHHSELDTEIYANCKIYVDSWAGAKSELKTLHYEIEGEVGEVINKLKPIPTHNLTVFHSMGMAVEDTTVAQLIYEQYKQNHH